MAKKKMQKLDLSNFFIQNEEEEGFKLLIEEEEKEPEVKLPKGGQKLFVRKERKGRGGKVVTVIEGYKGNPQVLEDLAKQIKQHCGVGGSTKGKDIIIQGDKAAQLAKFLISKGYNAKQTTM